LLILSGTAGSVADFVTNQLDAAIEALAAAYVRYIELIVGASPDPIVPLERFQRGQRARKDLAITKG